MACTTTTAMYLNISTQICATVSTTDRVGNDIYVTGLFNVDQTSPYNLDAIYAKVDGYTNPVIVKQRNTNTGYEAFSFNFTDSSAGTRTFTCTFYVGNSAGTQVGNTASVSFSVSYPAAGSAPSNGYINNLSSYWGISDQAIVIHSTSVGCNSGGLTLSEMQVKFGTTPYTDSGWPDASTHATFAISNGQEVWCTDRYRTSGTLSIIGNKQYYSGIYAANSAGSYRYKTADGAPTIVTVPPQVDVWINNANNSPTTKQIGVWFRANGGYYTQTFQYRINGGSWVNGTTKTGGTAETKYVNLTGLTPHTAYTVETRVTTTAGTTVGPTVSFMTPNDTDNLYGSTSGLATHINALYGSVNSQAKKICKLYGSVNGVAKPIFIRHVHE